MGLHVFPILNPPPPSLPQTLFFWAPKSLHMVTAAMKLKRCLLLERKVMTNLDSILKSRDITLPTKVHLVKAMIFPVVMYGKIIALTRWTFVGKGPSSQSYDFSSSHVWM